MVYAGTSLINPTKTTPLPPPRTQSISHILQPIYHRVRLSLISQIDRRQLEMAIIQGIPGLEVYIEVAGKRLKEYDVPQGAKDVLPPPEIKQKVLGLNIDRRQRQINHGYVAKYIEVESGTYPCVQFTKTADFRKEGHHIAYNVKFDDNELELRHQPPGPLYEDWEDSIDSVVVGTSQEQRSQRFRFENLTRSKFTSYSPLLLPS